jgi:hypothetical protein
MNQNLALPDWKRNHVQLTNVIPTSSQNTPVWETTGPSNNASVIERNHFS